MKQDTQDDRPVGRVLVVDDEGMVRRLFKRTLGDSGFVVDTAEDASEAEKRFYSQRYEAIFADIGLPDENGMALLEKIKKTQRNTPVIIFTGLPTVETAADALRLGAYDYLTKPVDPEVLISAATRAVETKRLREEKKRLEKENRAYQRTLEKRVEKGIEELRESEKRYRTLFEESKDAIFITALDGSFLDVNQAALDLFGYPREDIMKLKAIDFYVHPEANAVFRKEIERKGFVKDFELVLKGKGGNELTCLLTANSVISRHGTISGYRGILRDVTTEKRAEEEIRRQKEFLETIIESLSHPFYVVNANDFTIKMANSASDFGVLNESSTCYGLTHGEQSPCHSPEHPCPIRMVKRRGRPASVEHIHTDKEGNARNVEVHGYPIFDESGRIVEVLVYAVDITARKRLESVAEATNLMENIGFIFSGIRHEIGNPLNSIKTVLTVLKKRLETLSTAEIQECVSDALAETSRVEYLLKALKNFSMFESPDIQLTDIHDFMDTLTPLVEADFRKRKIAIERLPSSGPCWGLIDPRAFHQVMLNLLTNAAEALDQQDAPRISISLERRGGLVEVKVGDNGCGMTEEDQRNLFRPFFTTKPQGTGLGLVIVKRMLSSMNGFIEIESRKGVGTTVNVYIPEGRGENSESETDAPGRR